MDIVCTSYKTPDDLRRFGASLAAHRPTVPFSLTIVSVCPEREDIAAAREVGRELRGTVHLCESENIGYGRACNKAASFGHREVVALFNADIEITPGALDECFAAMLDHRDWAVLGPRQTNRANLLTHGGIFGPDTAPYLNGWMQYDRGQCSQVVENAYSVAGSAYFIRRSVWDQLTACPIFQEVFPGAVGAFLPTPLWFEETWCSVHARAHGEKVVFYGPTRLIHEVSSSINRRPGEWRAATWATARGMFRAACRAHRIQSD